VRMERGPLQRVTPRKSREGVPDALELPILCERAAGTPGRELDLEGLTGEKGRTRPLTSGPGSSFFIRHVHRVISRRTTCLLPPVTSN
jgi:hypothetical protein